MLIQRVGLSSHSNARSDRRGNKSPELAFAKAAQRCAKSCSKSTAHLCNSIRERLDVEVSMAEADCLQSMSSSQ